MIVDDCLGGSEKNRSERNVDKKVTVAKSIKSSKSLR